MSLLQKKELQVLVGTYKNTYARYEVVNKGFALKVVKLYKERKATIPALRDFYNYVIELKNNESFMALLGTAESIKSFESLVAKEEAGEKCDFLNEKGTSNLASSIAGAAGAAGLATALGGQAALWAAASAFGTTAGGTAIGTLAGAAELNAFLAWLGGGAVAAGGGGVAAGSAIFAAVPVVGWVVAGVGATIAAIGVGHSRKKNLAKIAEVQTANAKLSTLIHQLSSYGETAAKLTNRIVEKKAYLHPRFFESYPKDCEKMTAEQRSYIETCCNCYVQICRDINASIA
jgi:hypothetical protein